jgi:hypothetical protein
MFFSTVVLRFLKIEGIKVLLILKTVGSKKPKFRQKIAGTQ